MSGSLNRYCAAQCKNVIPASAHSLLRSGMANFGETRRSAFGRAHAAQHYATTLLGLNAADRHRKLVNDYLTYYARGVPGQPGGPPAGEAKAVRTDADALREHHRFIRTEEDDGDHGWEARLAKRYYDRLFKVGGGRGWAPRQGGNGAS